MRALLAFLALWLAVTAASAQYIIQSGPVTQNHATMWCTDGVACDAGTAASGFLSSLGTTGQGPTICASSAPITQPRNQICLGADATGGTLSMFSYGGATGGLSFNVNGSPLNTLLGTGTTGEVAVWASSSTLGALTGPQLTSLVNVFTASTSGAVPASGGGTSNFLRADGTWALVTAGVSSVSNSDGTLTVSPTTGAAVASLALGNANTWTATQTFPANSLTLTELPQINAKKILGNATGSTGNVTATFTASNATDTTVPLAHGSITNGDCAQFNDTAGTLVDSGAPCSSGGGGSVTASSKDFLDGTDYTSGTTTSLSLPSAPANSNSLTITFDGIKQHLDTWSLVGTTVTFNAAIPLHTKVVEAVWWGITGLIGVNTVRNLDGTLTISPTAGSVVASLALGNANTWTATQTFPTGSLTFAELPTVGSGFFLANKTAVTAAVAGNGYQASNITDTTVALVHGTATSNDCVAFNDTAGTLKDAGNPCGGVVSVANSDGTLSISTVAGAVTASLALGHANTWTATQTFVTNSLTLAELPQIASRTLLGNATVSTGNVTATYTAASTDTTIATVTGTVTASNCAAFNDTVGTLKSVPCGVPPGGLEGQVLGHDATKPAWIDQCVNIEAYGATTGASDNSTAFTNAFAGLPAAGGCIEFPAGKWKFTSPVVLTFPAAGALFHFTLKGEGPDETVLNWASGSGLKINYQNTNTTFNDQGADIRDLAITTSTTNAGTGLWLNQTTHSGNGSNTAPTNIDNVVLRGDDGYAGTDYWTTQVNIVGVSNVNVTRSLFMGPATAAGTGLIYSGLSASDFAVVLNLSNDTFNFHNVGFQYGRFVQGVTVTSTNFTGYATAGIYAPAYSASSGTYNSGTGVFTLTFATTPYQLANGNKTLVLNCPTSGLNGSWTISSGSGTTTLTLAGPTGLGTITNFAGCQVAEFDAAQLSISNSQFGQFGAGANGILLQTYLNNFQLTNNDFGSTSGNTNATFAYIYAMANFEITGNQFQAGNTTGTFGINISNFGYSGAVTGTITGNVIVGTEFAVNIASTAGNVTTQGNRYLANTFAVVDNGTADQVWDSPVGVSAITPSTGTFVYTASSHPETVYIRGGTVTHISVGGTDIATATLGTTPVTVQLWPNEAVSVTNSIVPTMIKDVH